MSSQMGAMFRYHPSSLTADAIPAVKLALASDRERLPRSFASDLLARAGGPETEQQLLEACRGVRKCWASMFCWAVRQGREDIIRQLAAPPAGADTAAAAELHLWLADWRGGISLNSVPPAMLGVLQRMGLNPGLALRACFGRWRPGAWRRCKCSWRQCAQVLEAAERQRQGRGAGLRCRAARARAASRGLGPVTHPGQRRA